MTSISENPLTLGELVQLIVTELVSKPDLVRVRESRTGSSSLVELEVAKSDTRFVIGRRGQNISALRTILNAAAAQRGQRFTLFFLE